MCHDKYISLFRSGKKEFGKVLLINKRNIPLEVTTLANIKVYRQSAYTLGRKTIKSTLLKQFEINIHIYITLILP